MISLYWNVICLNNASKGHTICRSGTLVCIPTRVKSKDANAYKNQALFFPVLCFCFWDHEIVYTWSIMHILYLSILAYTTALFGPVKSTQKVRTCPTKQPKLAQIDQLFAFSMLKAIPPLVVTNIKLWVNGHWMGSRVSACTPFTRLPQNRFWFVQQPRT